MKVEVRVYPKQGVLDPQDARVARESGVDGVIVSNHGGRQLDGAMAPLRRSSQPSVIFFGVAAPSAIVDPPTPPTSSVTDARVTSIAASRDA